MRCAPATRPRRCPVVGARCERSSDAGQASTSVTAVKRIGAVTGIYLSAEARGVPQSVQGARAVAGRGLEGDRYFIGSGTWSYASHLWSELTLIEAEALEAAEASGVHLDPADARRNVVTAGLELGSLIGRRFSIGEVELVGERPCDPCRHLDRITGQPARAALVGRGGLRASILAGGVLRVGACVLSL